MGVEHSSITQAQRQPAQSEGAKVALPLSVPTQQTDTYKDGQKLFDSLQWTLEQKAGSSKSTETFKYRDPCSGCHYSKHMFIDNKGTLQEFEHNGTYDEKRVPKGNWKASKATEYYLVGNLLLDKDGGKFGEVALHPSNNKIEKGQTLVKGSFTFKDNNGCVRCIDANQLCVTGISGMPPGVIRLGMPPAPKVELEVRYELKSRHHLVDTNNRCYQYGVKYSDKEHSAYEIKVVQKQERNKISLNTSEINELYSDNHKETIKLKSSNGSEEIFYVKKGDDGIHLSKTKGGEAIARIRNLAENPVPRAAGEPKPYEEPILASVYVLERMVSTKTYFWDCYKCGDLAVAKGGWVEDKNFQVTNDLQKNTDGETDFRLNPESFNKPQGGRKPAPTPKVIEEDPFK